MTVDKSGLSLDLDPELIKQYEDALSVVAGDLRLVVLLAYNAFEEVMKAIAAWRLGCLVSEMPRPLRQSLLFEVVLAGCAGRKEYLKQAVAVNDARREVAHAFHKRKA